MNWNNNDTKYIIKRFIIYILIAFAMFIIGTWKAHALTAVENNFIIANTDINQTGKFNRTATYNINNWKGLSNGEVFFTIATSRAMEVYNIYVEEASSSRRFTCFFGADMGYADNTSQYHGYSVRCPADFVYGGLKRIGIDAYVHTSGIIIWPTDVSYYSYDMPSDVISAIQQASSTNAINNLNTQMQNASSQAHTDAQNVQVAINNQSTQQHQDAQAINNSINNDNITSSDADDLTNNQAFSDSTGLQAVIELPLNMINSLTNTCQPISITIPWLDYTGTIPCMSTIYSSKFNSLYQVVKLIINGFLVYRLLLKVYELVHEAKQPDEDKLEVIDL